MVVGLAKGMSNPVRVPCQSVIDVVRLPPLYATLEEPFLGAVAIS